MRVVKVAVEAIRRKNGKNYEYGSAADLLCKYLVIIIRPLCPQFLSNNSHARFDVIISFARLALNY